MAVAATGHRRNGYTKRYSQPSRVGANFVAKVRRFGVRLQAVQSSWVVLLQNECLGALNGYCSDLYLSLKAGITASRVLAAAKPA